MKHELKIKKKIFIGTIISLVAVIFASILISVVFCQNEDLRSLENEVSGIILPAGVEKIAVRGAVGDSGGNGNYSTLRVVLLVKTEFDINELKSIIGNMDLRFRNHYKNSGNIPIFYVAYCTGSIFHSPREFSLYFDELDGIIDYSNYYFIEFVE